MSTSTLSATQLSQFERDGFLAVRGLFDPSEIDTIRATFMDTAKDGPVPGLSDAPKAREGAPATASDPLAFYPRMMHPHKHPDKPVGPLAMRYMRDARCGRSSPSCSVKNRSPASRCSTSSRRAHADRTCIRTISISA